MGGANALQSLTTDAGGTLSLQDVRTKRLQTFNDTTVSLSGTLTVTEAGYGVSIPNAVNLLSGGGTVTLTGNNAANDVTLGTVNGARSVAITAAGGDVQIGAAGGSTPVTGLTVTASGTTSLSSVRTGSGGVNITSTSGTTLNANIETNTGANSGNFSISGI